MNTSELRRAVEAMCREFEDRFPGTRWREPLPDRQVTSEDGKQLVLRIYDVTAEGTVLRLADSTAIAELLAENFTCLGFSQPEVTGSPWGQLVCRIGRDVDGATLEWRGWRGMRLWLDVPLRLWR